ncbi:3-phosphoshikimate 1-carboxyvinyltransferase [Ornithobacterium rhinotracheale]|uniref:3-phosphoshikimate 1-carboxyvinyltransferase n=1 Tax=Ornithobacterium rhinotracheale (strain ATCC 51463 / DSM 15997 / CCUG 23171 / CIP 104009 / LMG 9086) TaxID=867902 RepID=I4A1P3_ORNRL|nr:3-phosphoshikimate 1-carboxyvinyltransferase [Ornithobacterium rhinotracheale]AFL97877.1 5-enolpyruvylshikimate-3-phosphate synthase [Ornithobacterium rhinotracheale DSM 15997]AIP99695.1 3-phosphoshikimate 1-carboxyvinyltransferase [Ornithobacterium rhinotracheale ORT-UMN 88]KGB65927.1 3-phosphoshikimate 1-carboxyvinyltransferase [Ornithobacterium rhinotracheale H06-030791]MBN3661554.1 3-phosphoshikimate 1-carboxyvinyltransferase [Ornithobacterium rhinotracheale]MCK0193829.1 3-phosphoshikim
MKLIHHSAEIFGEIEIGGSKSESNRWLILKKLFPEIKDIENIADAEDTKVLRSALQSDSREIDIHHAGTAMRFLTAYYALSKGKEVILTGSKRMQERPIAPLVEALRKAGADIEYVKKEGYPPLKITGRAIQPKHIEIQANLSSQYISALMLVAPKLRQGLEIKFTTELTSKPYIEMTKAQLESVGIKVEWFDDETGIRVFPCRRIRRTNVVVESDWSSASYWYSMAALSKDCDITLSTYKKDSLQGDARLVPIYEKYFGVMTLWRNNKVILRKKTDFTPPEVIRLDLNKNPDLAQTIAITCAGLKIKAMLTGLHTLKIKETDRLVALQAELEKCGVKTIITGDSIELVSFENIWQTPTIETYQDHRMALSFTPLAVIREMEIKEPEVVGKSYPNFWKDLERVGFNIQP